MLFAGSDDGVYRVRGLFADPHPTAEQVLESERIYRVEQLHGIDGLFAAGEAGLFYTPDGASWQRLPVPEQQVYAVTAHPAGDRLYAGTRPSKLYVAETEPALEGEAVWSEVGSFRDLRERADWGIPRHDGISQVRSLRTHPDVPDRLIVGVEVGGIHVRDDSGEHWDARHIEGFDAPHTDDIHHLELADASTILAATGSGLFRSGDVGRTWERLDTGRRQRYIRESLAYEGVVYAGAAPASSTSWEEDTDHVLLEGTNAPLEAVETPTPAELPLGWCVADGTVLTATHHGSLLARGAEGWKRVGNVSVPGQVRGRYLPLTWVEE